MSKDKEYELKLSDTIWTAKTLFNRKLVTGSTGNISFRYEDLMYITKSGSCFGRLTEDSFAVVDMNGKIVEGKPSKEYPIHLNLYKANENNTAVIHTHSLYSTVMSCLNYTKFHLDKLFSNTPYLKMLTKGKIGFVEYNAPGSEELFDSFKKQIKKDTNAYLMNNHGVVVSAETMMKAFYLLEEFEVSAQTLMLLHNFDDCDVNHI